MDFFHKRLLSNHELDKRRYLFFPSNFWPNKNHRLLLTAFNIFTKRNSEERLDLVFTSSLENYANNLKDDAKKMGLIDRVHFIITESKRELAAFWKGCFFSIFPSLEEACCLFLLEAMYFKRPILCSCIPLFQRVAGDAALYFDPRNAENIAGCLENITKDAMLRSDLVKLGRQRLEHLKPDGSHKHPGNSFIFLSGKLKNMFGSITGIYDDRWTGPEVMVFFDHGPRKRYIEFHFDAPSHLPAANISIHWRINNQPIQERAFARGNDIVVRQVLPRNPGCVTVCISPVFRPSAVTEGSVDHRFIGCLCHGCWIVTADRGRIPLFVPENSSSKSF